MRHRATYLSLAAALMLLTTTACSDGDDPSVLPTLTPTPTPTATALAIPPAATPNTSQGLDAFVRFYFDQLNAAFSSGDSLAIRSLSDPACDTCENYADSLDGDDNHVEGVSFASVLVAAPPVQPSGTIVEVTGEIPTRRLVDPAGSTVKTLPAGGRFHFQVNVLRRGDSWVVRGIRKAP